MFSLEDALTVVAARSRLMEALPAGAMLSIPMAEAEARRFLGPDVAIAAVNGPSLCVVSGLSGPIAEVEARLHDAGVEVHRVKVEVGSHSPAVAPMLDGFSACLRPRLAAPAASAIRVQSIGNVGQRG